MTGCLPDEQLMNQWPLTYRTMPLEIGICQFPGGVWAFHLPILPLVTDLYIYTYIYIYTLHHRETIRQLQLEFDLAYDGNYAIVMPFVVLYISLLFYTMTFVLFIHFLPTHIGKFNNIGNSPTTLNQSPLRSTYDGISYRYTLKIYFDLLCLKGRLNFILKFVQDSYLLTLILYFLFIFYLPQVALYTRFSFCIFSGFLAIFILLSSSNNKGVTL